MGSQSIERSIHDIHQTRISLDQFYTEYYGVVHTISPISAPPRCYHEWHHSFKPTIFPLLPRNSPLLTMSETVRPAFPDRERPLLSYGLPFPSSAARHVTDTFSKSRVYVICSGSLSRNTDALDRLTSALGKDKVAGVRKGMKTHTLWSEVLEIVNDARETQADLLLTLGAGSLTDGAKIVALVRSQSWTV